MPTLVWHIFIFWQVNYFILANILLLYLFGQAISSKKSSTLESWRVIN
jgi:hypothetical protein